MKNKHLNEYSINLLEKYFEYLKPNKKTMEEVIDCLKSSYDVISITNGDKIIKNAIHFSKQNALNSWRNCYNTEELLEVYGKDRLLEEDDLVLKAFLVTKDAKSEDIYKARLNQHRTDIPFISIYVIIEINTGEIFTESSILNNELMLYSGINESDIENISPDLITYLLLLDEKLKL